MKRSKKFSIKNLDDSTIEHFGNEWKEFTQNEKEFKNQSAIFNDYFSVFDWKLISKKSIVMDVGSGSGRWAKFVANRVKHLILFDASFDALTVSKYNLSNINNVSFVNGSVDHIPVKNNSLDFVYSLGVLHHVPNTKSAILEISKKLKKNKPFLVYLYYNFDNRNYFYKVIWKISDIFRQIISKMPFKIKLCICKLISMFVYYPFARFSYLLDYFNIPSDQWPLKYYKDKSYYVMKTDALDRFGTPLEKRFSKLDIYQILDECGFKKITFSNAPPFWCALAIKG